MKIRAPANVFLHRAQVILILAALVPTILTTPLGIILLASGNSRVVDVVTGVLVLTFCASSLTGCILGWIFLRRGAELVRAQQDFLSSVSHELRTPMTSMRMFVEALLNDRLTDRQERARCLRTLHQEMRRLDGLVGRLIELSRLEAQQYPYARLPVSVKTIVADALAAFEAIQLNDAIEVDVAIADDDLWIRGDREALVQALVNLLANAWKYTGADKSIGLSVEGLGDKEIRLTVTDNGPGVPRAEQKRVFEKFVRGSNALESGTNGSGLGLAIVKGIVTAHRGRIELSSAGLGGAEFHLYLPRMRQSNLASAS